LYGSAEIVLPKAGHLGRLSFQQIRNTFAGYGLDEIKKSLVFGYRYFLESEDHIFVCHPQKFKTKGL